jgi:hypothetical protein
MRTRALLGRALALTGALALAHAGAATAQSIAAPPTGAGQPATGARRPEPRHPPGGLGGALTVGAAGMPGLPTGWLARLDYDLFPVLAPHGVPGPIVGFQIGWEVWRAKPDWGISLPGAIVFGIRAQPVRATLGLGVDALVVDVVDDDTGVGLYAPFASLRVCADVLGFQLGADARITRRWQIGAPDHTQWQLGAFAGWTWEATPGQPMIY